MSERYAGGISGNEWTAPTNVFRIEDYRRPDLNGVFGGLPVAEGVDVNLFSSLTEQGMDPQELRSTVISRYQGIVGKRTSAGFSDTLEINNEVAIALLVTGYLKVQQ